MAGLQITSWDCRSWWRLNHLLLDWLRVVLSVLHCQRTSYIRQRRIITADRSDHSTIQQQVPRLPKGQSILGNGKHCLPRSQHSWKQVHRFAGSQVGWVDHCQFPRRPAHRESQRCQLSQVCYLHGCSNRSRLHQLFTRAHLPELQHHHWLPV